MVIAAKRPAAIRTVIIAGATVMRMMAVGMAVGVVIERVVEIVVGAIVVRITAGGLVVMVATHMGIRPSTSQLR
jgi:hypothetical protein